MKKALTTFAFVLVTTTGALSTPNAQAHPYLSDSDLFSTALTLPTFWLTTLADIANHHKELYVAAQGDAIEYMANGTVSDLFAEAKAVLEQDANMAFESNDDAAKAIYLAAEKIKSF